MLQQEEKFKFPGIVPFCVEFQKTREEATEEYFNSISGDKINAYEGTLYPLELNLDNFTKLYWRMKELSLSVNLSNIYKGITRSGGGCEWVFDESFYINGDKGITTKEPGNALQSLEMRVCEPFDIEYSSTIITNNSQGQTERTFTDALDLFSSSLGLPQVIAEFNGGDPKDLNNYTYYPRLRFDMFLYTDNWGAFVAYNSSQASKQEEKTITVSIEGQQVGTFKVYRVSSNYSGGCPVERVAKNFGNWNFSLWSKPV
jgi:hypothetical protein